MTKRPQDTPAEELDGGSPHIRFPGAPELGKRPGLRNNHQPASYGKVRSVGLLCAVFGSAVLLTASSAHSHGVGNWGRPLEWHNDQIEQVISTRAQKVIMDGKQCLTGTDMGFRVRNEFAFDVDETVWLDIEYRLDSFDSPLTIRYDSNDPESYPAGKTQQIPLPKRAKGEWLKQRIALKRARFANLMSQNLDFTISAYETWPDVRKPLRRFTICNLSLWRSRTTSVAKALGEVTLEVSDEKGNPTPARVGIYDTSGRAPLPSETAITFDSAFAGQTRLMYVGPPWPAKNHAVFYLDGHYHARLPIGAYELIVAKGPEYRLARQHLTVRANETRAVKVALERWTDMVARGWYSGDDHIHYARPNEHEDHILEVFTQAEDLNVGNILEFDDIVQTFLPHSSWKAVHSDLSKPFVSVPGQEAPRTSIMGHTMLLNIKQRIRDPSHYLAYHTAFEEAHAQGGLAGFAHVIARGDLDPCYAPRALSMEVAVGQVDFAEVFTNSPGTPSAWFDYLNLGFKLAPTAGTDWPFGSVPGSVRTYVKIDGPFTSQAWFDRLKQGRSFITSGPLLEFSVNGRGMGSEMQVKSGETLAIEARASLNPDLGKLVSLELIEQGDTVKSLPSESGASYLEFHYEAPAKHGTWFVLRARDKDGTMLALSAPIYVSVDGQTFWKPSEVPSIVARLKAQMWEILDPKSVETACSEDWVTEKAIAQNRLEQRNAIENRIAQASAVYDALALRAASASPRI